MLVTFSPPMSLGPSPLRICRVCELEAYTLEDLEYFVKAKRFTHGRQNKCKNCHNKEKTKKYANLPEEEKEKARQHVRNWNLANKDHRAEYGLNWQRNNKEKVKQYNFRSRNKIRLEVLSHYSGTPPTCECCGENIIGFLTIDHIHGGGTKHRAQKGVPSGTEFYRWLKKQNYPQGYRVLCYNCNCAHGALGFCPHEIERSSDK